MDEKNKLLYNNALKLYRNSEFTEAMNIFVNLNKIYNWKLFEIYIQRCKYLLDNDIKDFDGVFEFKTK